MAKKIAELKVEKVGEEVVIPKATKDTVVERPKVVIGGLSSKKPANVDKGERFIGYGEEQVSHPFKKVIVVEGSKGGATIGFRNEATANFSIALDVVNYVALQASIDFIGREIKEKIKSGIIKAVEWDESLKTFVAELKVSKCLKEDKKVTITDHNAFTNLSLVDHSVITPEVKQLLHPEHNTICYRGAKLVLVFSVEAIVSFVLAKGVILPPGQEVQNNGAKLVKLEKHITMSNVEYKNDTLFYVLAFKEMPKEYTLLVPRANFIAINISMDERRASELLYDKVLSNIDKDAQIIYTPGAAIYKENDDYDINLKREYINGKAENPMDVIPMIKLDKSFRTKDTKYTNGIMNILVPAAEVVIQLDRAKIKQVYNKLIPQGAVMTYLVNEEPVLLVDTRVLFAMAITNDITDLKASIKSADDRFGFILHI